MSTSSLSSNDTACSGYDGSVFQATNMWKNLIKDLRKGLPLKKKWYKMKFYDNSFSGSEAIEWMHKYMHSSGAFGEIGKTQVTKLLEKFLQFKVFCEVREKESPVQAFSEGHVYHFVKTPTAFNCLEEDEDEENVPGDGDTTVVPSRSTCYTNPYAVMQFRDCGNDTTMDNRSSLMEVEEYPCMGPLKEAPAQHDSKELVAVWKQFVLTRLLRVVDLPTLDEVLNHESVDGKHILRNIRPLSHLLKLARSVSGSSSHAPTEIEAKPPGWVTMAQKYLMKWPEYNDEFHCEMPIYRGFEIDVLRAVWEYYSTAKEPLVCSGLHELFYSVLRLVSAGNTEGAVHALSLCMLLLPREKSLSLHRLLRFMHKVSTNQNLVLTDLTTNRQLMLDRFTGYILSSKKAAKANSKDMVAFMMDNYHHIFKIPDDLQAQVDQYLLQKGGSLEEATFASACKKVSAQEYAKQTDETSLALAGLLENVITSTKLSNKERKSKLKKFQQQYPEIYAARFS